MRRIPSSVAGAEVFIWLQYEGGYHGRELHQWRRAVVIVDEEDCPTRSRRYHRRVPRVMAETNDGDVFALDGVFPLYGGPRFFSWT